MIPQDMSAKAAAPHPRVTPPPDFVVQIEAAFTDVVVIGAVPEGVRIDAHYSGNVIAGPLAGGTVRGVDYLLIRSDGVAVLDVRETITTRAGQCISVRAQGYGSIRPVHPSGAEVVPSQGAPFTWPDAPSPILGTAVCQTSDPEFLWMNAALLVFSGTANLGTNKLQAVAHVLTRETILGGSENRVPLNALSSTSEPETTKARDVRPLVCRFAR